MTKQEIYTKVRNHLLAQGAKSKTVATGNCAYRGDHGGMCAIGCLIPDSKYTPDIEGYRVTSPRVQETLGLPTENRTQEDYENVRFLRELQDIHDGYYPEQWREELDNFARVHGLTVT